MLALIGGNSGEGIGGGAETGVAAIGAAIGALGRPEFGSDNDGKAVTAAAVAL